MTIDEMISVLQAAKSGKVVETKHNDKWVTECPECGKEHPWKFNFGLHQYRVKPEPREWEICERSLNQGCPSGSHKTIKVREVLE